MLDSEYFSSRYSSATHSRGFARIIPEGTEIFIPPYVLHRDPRNFSPFTNKFWPDRWLPRSQGMGNGEYIAEHYIHNECAFFPFSYGPYNCAGRNLARVELRATLVSLVHRFDMDFGDGFDKAGWLASLEDHTVIRATKPLPILFKVVN